MAPSSSSRLLDRVILALGLLGVLVVVHLGIQQSRGFDMGCLGFAAPAAVEAAFDCSVVVQTGAGTFLGMSNVFWGLSFYILVAVLSIGGLLSQETLGRRARAVRPAIIAAGFAYSLYLVYLQFFVIRELCALCLISASIVLLLTLTQAFLLYRERRAHPVPSRKKSQPVYPVMKEVRIVSALVVMLVVLVAADMVYYNGLEPAARTATAAASTVETRAASNPDLLSQCGFDEEKPTFSDYHTILGVNDPFVGNAEAPVTVIEFFDPNCPHCRTMHSMMKNVIAEYEDQARFFYKPVPLWQYSVAQIEALYAAAQEGKFDEMLQGQFDRQKQGGLNIREIKEIAGEIGMNPAVLEQRIERGIYRNTVMQQRMIASQVGLTGVPALMINGRFINSRSRTPACIGQLIEDAAG